MKPIPNVRPLQLAVMHILDMVRRTEMSANFNEPIPGDWSVQGFGMLRLYIRKVGRLHIWDRALRYPGVSMVHNHSWDLRSTVVSGALLNRRWQPEPIGEPWKRRRIVTGYDCKFVEEIRDVALVEKPHQYFLPGDVYEQKAAEIHMTDAEDGTITLMEREEDQEGQADLFWREDEQWGTAKPRPATREEVFSTIERAMLMLEQLVKGGEMVEVTSFNNTKRRYAVVVPYCLVHEQREPCPVCQSHCLPALSEGRKR